jgi:hypothetical protein
MIDRDDVLNDDYDFYDVLTLIDKITELEKELGTVKSRSNQAHSYLNSVTEYFDKHDQGGNYYKNLGECEDLLAIRDLEQQAKGLNDYVVETMDNSYILHLDPEISHQSFLINLNATASRLRNQAKALKEDK